MKRAILALGALSLVLPMTTADARTRHYYSSSRLHKVCRHSSGTTGLVAGGVGGAVIGSKVIGGGLLGAAVGAVGGALGGRAIDRTITEKKRCRYVRY